jgi:hypothetical protein
VPEADSAWAVTILVDNAVWAWRGRRWAHLVSDQSYVELHSFAERLGLERRWFQGDHYDVPTEYRAIAIELGAEAVDSRQLLRRLRASGLRLSPTERRQLPEQVLPRPVFEGVVGPIGEVQPRSRDEGLQHG